MQIKVSVKQLGKKRNILSHELLTVSDNIKTLKELVAEIVAGRVESYNVNLNNVILSVFSSEDELEENAEAGSVKFREKYNTTPQELDKAVENALLSFEDGIYKVFIDGNEIESLDEKINLHEDAELMFIKLIFLRGSFY